MKKFFKVLAAVIVYVPAFVLSQISRIGVVTHSTNKEFTTGEYSEPGKYKRFYIVDGWKIIRMRMTTNVYENAQLNAEKNKVDFPL